MPATPFDYMLANNYLPEVLLASEKRPSITHVGHAHKVLVWRSARTFVQALGVIEVVNEMNAFVNECRSQLQA
jgi:hypothetical protein